MNRYFRAEVSENRQIDRAHSILTVIPLLDFAEPEPGQFFMVGIGDCRNPLLKRPFSFFRRTGNGFQILYRIAGEGTSMLRNVREGAAIDILGPLGNPWPVPSKGETPLVVAGGVGIASLFSFIEKCADSAYIFYGAKTAHELLLLDELAENSTPFYGSTDDGSYGEKGTVVEILRKFLANPFARLASPVVYACGPKKMLEAVSKTAKDKKLTAYISMEENMACGIGACLGCAVKTVNGYKRVCVEGPVFRAGEIVW